MPRACSRRLDSIRSRESQISSFDKLSTNGKSLIPFVVSLSNHGRNLLIQCFPGFTLFGSVQTAD
jgi:hypothetical protein